MYAYTLSAFFSHEKATLALNSIIIIIIIIIITLSLSRTFKGLEFASLKFKHFQGRGESYNYNKKYFRL